MIPLRVYLRNFLCHQEQAFEFDGHPVWLLHGPNGVGKSAVFDAIVYALFGESDRREGSRTAVADLIRYGESSMRVEFDFEYRGRRYRVWRTRTRSGQPRQGVGEFVDGNPTPRPLPHVNRVEELDRWVCDTLGLSYDAFVSAVLLRQGAAERLMDAGREARRDLFRGIIDLDPYIRLHQRATEERTGLGRVVRELAATLRGMPEVTEEQVGEATAALGDAAAAWDRDRAKEAAARDRLAHARVWDGLDAACRSIRQELEAARDRGARAAELERGVTRLRELRRVVPALARVSELLTAATAAEGEYTRLAAEREAATTRHTELDAAAAQERRKATAHRDRAAELDREIGMVRGECDRLRAEIERADRAADLHRRLRNTREALTLFEAGLDAQLALAEEAVTEAQTARDAYPHLEVVRRNRVA
jgi:DNA repair exonuclease SbcCD ATPase subunit